MSPVTVEAELRRFLNIAARLGRRLRYGLQDIGERDLPGEDWRWAFDAYTKSMQVIGRLHLVAAKTKAPELSDEQYAAELVAIGLDHVRTMAVPELERVLRERGLSVVPLEGN